MSKQEESLNEQYNKFVEQVKNKPSVKILTEPINEVVKEEKSKNLKLEVLAMQLLLAIKMGTNDFLGEDTIINAEELNKKYARYITKPSMKNIIEAVSILQNQGSLEKADDDTLNAINKAFTKIGGFKSNDNKTKTKSKNKSDYDNPLLKDVVSQFEANESIVYLLNLASKVYVQELTLTKSNKALAALEILATLKESGENKKISFGKMSLDQARQKLGGSVSLDIVNICLSFTSALNSRIDEVKKASSELKQNIQNITSRFENIKQNLKES